MLQYSLRCPTDSAENKTLIRWLTVHSRYLVAMLLKLLTTDAPEFAAIGKMWGTFYELTH